MSTPAVPLPVKEPTVDESDPGSGLGAGRAISNNQLLGWSAVIGLAGGLLALGYYYLLKFSMFITLTAVPGAVHKLAPALSHYPWVFTTVGGLCVGLALKYLGKPGEIAAVVDNIHYDRGRIDIRQTPSMIVVSLISIAAGGSAGPEAPLVQIIGSLASSLGDKLKLRGDIVRTFTFSGMGAALGAFFGAPIGGALFALEIPHRRGLEYYEALVPSIISSILAFLVFRAVVGYENPMYHFGPPPALTLGLVWQGALLGVAGGFLAMLFVGLFRVIERILEPLHRRTVLLATLGGLAIGIIGQFFPLTLFWGEEQIKELTPLAGTLLADHGLHMAALLLLMLAFAKMFAVGFTLHGGFRGGFIFPLFFIGAATGLAIHLLVPAIPAPVAALCMMAAVNVAVTKTPISTPVILTTLSGTSMLPALVVASFASFLLTTRVSLIRTQRSRVVKAPVTPAAPRPVHA